MPRISAERRLLRGPAVAAVLLAAVVAIGTIGYVALEGWGWFDSFYMTMMTVTTTGGGEPHPMSAAGKWWTIIVVTVGFAALTFTLLTLISYVIEGRLGVAVGERRMRRRLAEMDRHFILCGYGRVGREVARNFLQENIQFVIIDINPDSLIRAADEGLTVVRGDAAHVDTLKAAGVERAQVLITCIDSDENNIYVTLSARVLNPKIFIVARANRDDTEPKLRLAGANRIISPYTIGGRRIASLAMRPTAVEFVDTVLSANNGELLLEDFTIPANSSWVGQTVSALAPDAGEVMILAMKRAGRMYFRPSDAELAAGDEIVAAGPPDGIRALEKRL
ncbi:MAG: TrkA family potassium uptake protein [Candidatus Eremiobacteraeota bacterium]|nr:TrkA family potassium uptake protein [Candidatus Eremiobacteraeota bacterium]